MRIPLLANSVSGDARETPTLGLFFTTNLVGEQVERDDRTYLN